MKTKNKFPELNDHQITETMRVCGGSFVASLAKTFRLADEINQAKLKAAFPEYWQNYAMMTRRCPECGGTNLMNRHHDGLTCGVPECSFRECEDCTHQFDHD